MPDFNIRIAVDPTNASSTVDTVKGSLAGLEQQATSSSAALTQGMAGAQSSAERLAASSQGVAASFGEQHEAAGVLEGSWRDLASQGGELGSVFESLASKGMIEVTALAALGSEALKLGDEYTQLQNAALRLVSSYDQVDAAISSQMSLSKDLHGSLDQTMELSIAIKEHTADLGLTQMETTRLTQEWGEAVQISGRSLADAGPAFERFSVALEMGQGSGRALRQLLVDYPPIAEELEKHFGVTTPAALKKLADEGGMSISDLKATMDEFAAENHATFGNMTETMGTQWDHLKDQLTVTIGKLVQGTGALDSIANAFKGVGSAIELATGPLQTFVDEINKLGGGHATIGDMFSGFLPSLLDKLTPAKEGMQTFEQIMKDVETQVGRTDLEQLAPAMGAVDTAAHRLTDTLSSGLNKAMQDLASGGVVALANDLKKLANPWADIKTAGTGGMSELQKAIESVNGPLDKIRTQENALDEAFARGKIGVAGYHAELEKLYEETTKLTEARDKMNAAFSGRFESKGPYTGGDDRQHTAEQNTSADLASAPHAQAAGFQVASIVGDTNKLDEYKEKLAQIDAIYTTGAISSAQYTSAVDRLKDAFDEWKSPAQKMQEQLAELDQAQRLGVVDAQEYAGAWQKIHEQFDKTDNSFGAGIANAFKAMANEAKNVAKETEQAFKTAFDSINKELVSLVMTGKADFGSLAKDLEKDLLSTALKQGESSLMGGILGALGHKTQGPGAQIENSMIQGGQTAGQNIATQFTTAGQQVAQELAAAMQSGGGAGALGGLGALGGGGGLGALGGAGGLGGLGGGGAEGLGYSLAGSVAGWFASGGDVDILHAASGLAGIVGGYGGTDSQFFGAMVTPGEHVSIKTPEQMAAQQQQGQQVVHNHYYTQGVTKEDVLRHMDSREGEQLMNAHIQKNQSGIRGAITKR